MTRMTTLPGSGSRFTRSLTRLTLLLAALGLFLALTVALSAVLAAPALAQQEVPQQADPVQLAEPDAPQQDNPELQVIDRRLTVGGYDLTVAGEASTLSLGTARFSVTVLDAATGQPISDARVTIRTEHSEVGEAGWATALNLPERPEIYRARMTLEYPGSWDVSVDIDGPLGRVEAEVGSVSIPVPRQYFVGTLVFAGVTLILLGGAAYMILCIRRAQRRRESANAG